MICFPESNTSDHYSPLFIMSHYLNTSNSTPFSHHFWPLGLPEAKPVYLETRLPLSCRGAAKKIFFKDEMVNKNAGMLFFYIIVFEVATTRVSLSCKKM